MAAPLVLPGKKLLVLVGDGAMPETFAQPCALKTKKFSTKAATATTMVPQDCDLDLPSVEAKDVTGLSMSLSASGILTPEAYTLWREWLLSGATKNLQIKLDHASYGHWTGGYKLTQIDITGETEGGKITIDVSIENDGVFTWVDA